MPCGDSEFLMWRRANGTRVGLQLSFGHPGELKAAACDGCMGPPRPRPPPVRPCAIVRIDDRRRA